MAALGARLKGLQQGIGNPTRARSAVAKTGSSCFLDSEDGFDDPAQSLIHLKAPANTLHPVHHLLECRCRPQELEDVCCSKPLLNQVVVGLEPSLNLCHNVLEFCRSSPLPLNLNTETRIVDRVREQSTNRRDVQLPRLYRRELGLLVPCL